MPWEPNRTGGPSDALPCLWALQIPLSPSYNAVVMVWGSTAVRCLLVTPVGFLVTCGRKAICVAQEVRPLHIATSFLQVCTEIRPHAGQQSAPHTHVLVCICSNVEAVPLRIHCVHHELWCMYSLSNLTGLIPSSSRVLSATTSSLNSTMTQGCGTFQLHYKLA